MDQLTRAADGVARVLGGLLGRCPGLVPPGRRGWAETVRAEVGAVPAGVAVAAGSARPARHPAPKAARN